MKLILSLTILLAITGFSSAVFTCTVNVNYNLYDLCSLTANIFTSVSKKYAYDFSVTTPNVPSCARNSTVWARGDFTNDLTGTLASDVTSNLTTSDECVDVAIGDPVASLINADDSSKGLILSFPISPNITNRPQFQITVVLNCDPNLDSTDQIAFTATNTTWKNFVKDSGPDHINYVTITGSTSYACPVASFSKVAEFIANNRVVFIIIFIVLGLIINFFGLRLFSLVIFIIATLATTMILFAIFVGFTDSTVKTWLLWTLFILSAICGLGVGILSLKYPKVGHFLIGGALGLIAGSLIFTAVISPFVNAGDGGAILMIVLLITALAGGIAGIYLIEGVIIIATSILGSYFAIRTLSFVIGGFPLESEIASGSKSFSAAAYGYIVAIAVLATGGVYFQFKMKRKSTEQEEAFKDSVQG